MPSRMARVDVGKMHPILIEDAELLELPEQLVAEMSAATRKRWIELRSFVFRAERLLHQLASTAAPAELP